MNIFKIIENSAEYEAALERIEQIFDAQPGNEIPAAGIVITDMVKDDFEECSVTNKPIPGESKIQDLSNHPGTYFRYPFHGLTGKKFVPKPALNHKKILSS